MKIETKMSGWSITDIDDIELVTHRFISFGEMNFMKPKTIKWILDNYEFHTGDTDEHFCETFKLPKEYIGKKTYGTFPTLDDEYKITIMEKYPEYEEQLTKAFGENWADYYLRFGH